MFKRHLWIWVFLTIFFVLGSAIFGKSIVAEQVGKEQKMVAVFMQSSAADRIRERTNSTYSFCCNWLADLTRTYFVPPSQDEEGLFNAMDRGHQEFWTSVYLIIYRVYILLEWVLVFWVVFIAALVQGLVRRDIAVINTAWSSPIRYHSGLHFALATIAVQINLLFYPWPLHPFIPVLMLTVFSFVLFVIASNIQHKV